MVGASGSEAATVGVAVAAGKGGMAGGVAVAVEAAGGDAIAGVTTVGASDGAGGVLSAALSASHDPNRGWCQRRQRWLLARAE